MVGSFAFISRFGHLRAWVYDWVMEQSVLEIMDWLEFWIEDNRGDTW